jgi:hypothetical protein
MMEGGGDSAYNEDECGDGIVGTDERGAAAAHGNDTNYPFSRLCLHKRLVLALTSPTGPFKLERVTTINHAASRRCCPEAAATATSKIVVGEEWGGTYSCRARWTGERRLRASCRLSIDLPPPPMTDGARRPSPGGGAGAAGADRKSGGTWCVLLYPTRKPAMQTHSLADQLFGSLFPRIVPGCLSGGEKRKSEKAWLRRGITLLVATPGHPLNHLTKTESLLLLLRQIAASSGLSSTRLIAFWTGVASGGRWRRLFSGFAGDAAAWRVGSGQPVHSRACWCWRR